MSESPQVCCVPGCVNSDEQESKRANTTFFKFPRKDASLMKKWLERLQTPDWKPGKKKKICSNHFEETCFSKTFHGRFELTKDAVPTVFCRVETAEPYDIFTDYCNDEVDHLMVVSDYRTRYEVFKDERLYKIISVIDKDLALREQIMRKTIPDHPNILKVTKYAMNEQCFTLQFEKFGSNVQTLTDFLAGLSTENDVKTRASLARQLLRGVQHLHKCMLLHTQLTADNVFVGLSEDGQPLLKIAEFAFSNHVEQLLEDDDICTPPHIRGASTLAADILAAGRLLYLIKFGKKLQDKEIDKVDTSNLSENEKNLITLMIQNMVGVPKSRPNIDDVITTCDKLLSGNEHNQSIERSCEPSSRPSERDSLAITPLCECKADISSKRKVPLSERQNHDREYHILNVMLIIVVLLKKKVNLSLTTDYRQAGIFGDIKFSFEDLENTWHNLYIQLKHMPRTHKKISISEFLPNLKPLRGKPKNNSASKIVIKDLIRASENVICSNGTCKNQFILITNQELNYNEKDYDPNLKETMFETKKENAWIENSLQFKDTGNDNKFHKTILQSGVTINQVQKFFKDFSIVIEQLDYKHLPEVMTQDLMLLLNVDEQVAHKYFLVLRHWLACWIQDENAIVLNNNNLRELMEHISRIVQNSLIIMPRKELEFYSRENEQSKICQIFQKPTGKPIDLVVTGIPGVGKTELVRKCIEKNQHQFVHTLWMPAFSIDIIIRTFVILYHLIFMRNITKELVSKILHDVYEYLNNEKCIIIFDNVIKKEDILQFLPSKFIKNSIFIVVTTSDKTEWDCGLLLKVNKFTLEESENFLKTSINGHLKGPSEEKLLRELAGKLENLPRNLNQAVEYMRENDLSVSSFLSQIKQQPQLEDKKFEEDENKSVANEWHKALEAQKQQVVMLR